MSDEGGSVTLGSNSVEWPGESPTELLAGISSVGGGRGVFAKIDIGPGQLVLVERPLVTVPDDKFPEVSNGPSLSSSYGPMGQSMWSLPLMQRSHYTCHWREQYSRAHGIEM